MNVRLQLFAAVQELADSDALDLELPAGATVRDLRPARSAVDQNNEVLTNSRRNERLLAISWQLRNFYGRRAELFRSAPVWVGLRSQRGTTSEEAMQFDCLANVWSDQAGRERRAPVCRAYYILGFLVREVRRPC